MTDLDDDPRDDITAAELALGLLDGEDRAAAVRRVLAEPEFAREVERWREHFALLFAQWPEVAPSDELARRLDRSLAPAAVPRRFWPALAIAASAIAAVLAGILILQPAQVAAPPSVPTGPAVPTFVANLAPANGAGAVVPALYDPARHEIQVAAAALAEPGRSAELWLIPADGKPRSLGLLAGGSRTTVKLTPELRALIGPKAALAVSSEPRGGSPTGRPTGAILASGSLIPV